jgi:predicted phosphate transport protein (TIGR00153 family)
MKFNILDLLLPREVKFFKYMISQAEIFIEGCELFKKLATTIDKISEDEAKNIILRINEFEQKGDDLEHKIIDELHKTFITPLDREDIHSIAINIDKSLDILNSISRKFEIYGIRNVPINVCRFADVIVEISIELRNLFTALESKKDINDIVKRMHGLENKADTLFYTSVAELFSNGKYNPVEIIKYKEIYEHLESIVDSVDFIGKIVRGIAVKQG